MINADISTDDNYNIVFCAAKYPNIISYWCGRQCYLELRVRVPVLMLIYCDNQDTIPHLGKGITTHYQDRGMEKIKCEKNAFENRLDFAVLCVVVTR